MEKKKKKYYINLNLGIIAPVGSCINRARSIKDWAPFTKLDIEQDGDIITLVEKEDGSYFQNFSRSIPMSDVVF